MPSDSRWGSLRRHEVVRSEEIERGDLSPEVAAIAPPPSLPPVVITRWFIEFGSAMSRSSRRCDSRLHRAPSSNRIFGHARHIGEAPAHDTLRDLVATSNGPAHSPAAVRANDANLDHASAACERKRSHRSVGRSRDHSSTWFVAAIGCSGSCRHRRAEERVTTRFISPTSWESREPYRRRRLVEQVLQPGRRGISLKTARSCSPSRRGDRENSASIAAP